MYMYMYMYAHDTLYGVVPTKSRHMQVKNQIYGTFSALRWYM